MEIDVKPTTPKRLRGEYLTLLRQLFAPFERIMAKPSTRRYVSQAGMGSPEYPDPSKAPKRLQAKARQLHALRQTAGRLERDLDHLGWEVTHGGRLQATYKVRRAADAFWAERQRRQRDYLLALNTQARLDLLDMAPKQAAQYLRTLRTKLQKLA